MRTARRVIAIAALIVIAAPAAAHAQYVPETLSISLSTTTAAPGDNISVEVDGCAAGAEVTITIESEPQVLGTFTADEAGALLAEVGIPLDIDPGDHMITASCLDEDGEVLSASASITIVDPAEEIVPPPADETAPSGILPVTGGSSAQLLAAAAALLVAGAGIAFVARRRVNPVV